VRRSAVIALALLVTGCEKPVDISLLSECFTNAAFEAYRAESRSVPAPPAPQKCCGKCTNGKVRSGDGIAWVDCPCPPSCQCKPKGAKR
jgi:hypothetical protein